MHTPKSVCCGLLLRSCVDAQALSPLKESQAGDMHEYSEAINYTSPTVNVCKVLRFDVSVPLYA